jgi:glycosyltransferase involved in cell wall biosynthesis/SAM-dependent methyltransferase
MRFAYFSPMPPSRSGIADYSQALVASLRRRCELEIFAGEGKAFLPEQFDAALYQIGNNAHHEEAYRTALTHPGVVVLHEANLHHLLAEITIKRGDWDSYIREIDFDGGVAARDYAFRVRALEVGPDYEGVPVLRRLLASARGLIAHSHYVIGKAREAGYTGPATRIPHGAWIPQVDRMRWRHWLGLDHRTVLIGVFGHLKPYKRIPESLRAFRRLLQNTPSAKMVLVGEPHPELPIESMISALGLDADVRLLGHVGGEEFTGALAACDIVLNLRYPTVGETSGTLLRSLGLGKAVIISDVGAFHEFPDDVCLKVPVGAGEEDLLFEYLNLLASRRDLALALGSRAHQWVQFYCNWDRVAGQYTSFLQAVAMGKPWIELEQEIEPAATPVMVEPDYIRGWAADKQSAAYIDTHLARLEKTLELTPPGGAEDAILEMGAYMQITPSLKTRLGYGVVRGCYYGPAYARDHKLSVSRDGERFECDIDLFDAEKDPFPYEDGAFSTVLCCELIEHLPSDPMHMLSEINRILRDGGHLVLTTPNIASWRALSAILQAFHPGFFPAYLRPPEQGEPSDARHNREYTPAEIERVLGDAGFEVVRLETGPFRSEPRPDLIWVEHLLDQYGLPNEFRGDGIYAVARKAGPIRERWPAWLYS